MRKARSQPASVDAEPGVELEAVDDLDAVFEEHVLGAQVAVAVADVTGGGSRLQLGAMCGEEHVREAGECRVPAREVRVGGELDERLGVLVERLPQRGGGVDAVACRGRGVELGESPADRDERRVGHAAVGDARPERAGLVEPAHLDHVVDGPGVVLGRERDAVGGRDDGLDAEVHARGEPAVQPDLLAAHLPAALDGAVVEEREPHRLLELVGAVAGEENPRDVRLADLDRTLVVRVRLGAGHSRRKRGPGERRTMSDGGHAPTLRPALISDHRRPPPRRP